MAEATKKRKTKVDLSDLTIPKDDMPAEERSKFIFPHPSYDVEYLFVDGKREREKRKEKNEKNNFFLGICGLKEYKLHEAVKFLGEAAESGHIEAQNLLHLIYEPILRGANVEEVKQILLVAAKEKPHNFYYVHLLCNDNEPESAIFLKKGLQNYAYYCAVSDYGSYLIDGKLEGVEQDVELGVKFFGKKKKKEKKNN
jgi:TPR repeat protein